MNANVKLRLAHSLIRLRRKSVHMRGGPSKRPKYDFVVHVPLKYTRLHGRRVRTSGTPLFRAPTPILPIPCRARRRRGKGAQAGAGCGMLIMRSSRSVHHCVYHRLTDSCRALRDYGNGRTLRDVFGGAPSLMVDSIVVPRVSKLALYHGVGRGIGLGRVPMVLLATGAQRRSGLRNLRAKTSTCVAGPFRVRVLEGATTGLVHDHRQLHGACAKRRARKSGMRPVRMRSPSSGLVRQVVQIVGRGLDGPGLAIRVVAARMNVDHIRLRHGLGRLAGRAAQSFVQGVQLGRTTRLLSGGQCAVTRITSLAKFAGPGGFSATFGSLCKVPPDVCVRRRLGRSGGGRRG